MDAERLLEQQKFSPRGLTVARIGLGLSVSELAAWVPVKIPSRISEMEAGKRDVSDFVVRRVNELRTLRTQLVANLFESALAQIHEGVRPQFDLPATREDFWAGWPQFYGLPLQILQIAADLASETVFEVTGILVNVTFDGDEIRPPHLRAQQPLIHKPQQS
ncbi:MAG: hypothetical protein LBR20_06390 [Propionibacteriaceae bacterium]|nr:hypothetical protein [Propionibacteriaceae bacterium]